MFRLRSNKRHKTQISVYCVQRNIACLHVVSNIGGEQSDWSRPEQTAGLED